MKKQTLWLLMIGNLCMTFTLFTSPFMKVPLDAGDFLKGFGIALVISAFFLELKNKRATSR